MEKAPLGDTGLVVSRLGAGMAEIGSELTLDDLPQISRVLNTALDNGINFLDTSASYFDSEIMIGRTIAHRRDEYILATKCGKTTWGYSDQPWAAHTIRNNIDRSLTRMKTDHLDLVQLHSCDVLTLERGEAINALLKAKQEGKTRFVGYSGDNETALWAVESGQFDTLQTSFSVVDQHARTGLFGPAKARGMGIIIKRPIASGAWGAGVSPSASLNHYPTYADEYFLRAQTMARLGLIPGAPEDRILVALGFVLAHPEVDTAILGTRDPGHMTSNIDIAVNRLPIPAEVVQELHRRFDSVGGEWRQLD